MLTEIIMPKNGMDMKEGVITRWLKEVGDSVELDEPILEIETDKITMECEALAEGILLEKFYNDGDKVPVLTVIGYIGDKGDIVPDSMRPSKLSAKTNDISHKSDVGNKEQSTGQESSKIPVTPKAKAIAKAEKIDLSTVRPSGRSGEIVARDVKTKEREGVNATALAKAIAEAENIDINGLTGSGFGSKIIKQDVLSVSGSASRAGQFIAISGMRNIISKRMLSSHVEIPPVTQNMRIDMTDLLKIREGFNEGVDKNDRITINDFIIKAVALSLLKCERFLLTLVEGGYLLHQQINIGVAVSTEDGLLVPVIRDADKKTLRDISREVKTLTGKARSGKLSANECGDARITITNLGMYGVHSFTPIINQPEAAIVGVCTVEDFPCLINGQLSNRKKMILSVTYDHRILNGSEVAVFEKHIKELLETPYSLLLL